MASLLLGGKLKNATHTSPGNPVEFNQSDDDFDTPEVFPLLCAICIQMISQHSVGVTSEAETNAKMRIEVNSRRATRMMRNALRLCRERVIFASIAF